MIMSFITYRARGESRLLAATSAFKKADRYV